MDVGAVGPRLGFRFWQDPAPLSSSRHRRRLGSLLGWCPSPRRLPSPSSVPRLSPSPLVNRATRDATSARHQDRLHPYSALLRPRHAGHLGHLPVQRAGAQGRQGRRCFAFRRRYPPCRHLRSPQRHQRRPRHLGDLGRLFGPVRRHSWSLWSCHRRSCPALLRPHHPPRSPVHSDDHCHLHRPPRFTVASGSAYTVFGYLANLTAVAGLSTWAGICVIFLRFHYGMKKQGISRDILPFKSPLQPYLGYWGLFWSLIVILFSGFSVFIQGQWTPPPS